jgi:hypothetical protein
VVEFDCEGCGGAIVLVYTDERPKSGLCNICEWLCEHVPDPETMMQIRASLEPSISGALLGARGG